MNRVVYRSGVDLWLWIILLLVVATVVVFGMTEPWWVTAIFAVLTVGMLAVGLFGIWYAIEGDDLIVYQFFYPHRLPISKIAEVKYCRGYIAGPASSSRRLSIKFSDRRVLKSYAPIEISPKDRDAFVAHLLTVNPAIKVVK